MNFVKGAMATAESPIKRLSVFVTFAVTMFVTLIAFALLKASQTYA